MDTVGEHNKKMFKVIETWLNRDRSKVPPMETPDLICTCGKELVYKGCVRAKYHVGPFWQRDVYCPDCGQVGVKSIRVSMVEWSMMEINEN